MRAKKASKSTTSKSEQRLGRSRKRLLKFAESISIAPLVALIGELEMLRQYPPVTQRSKGRYEGDILGFIRGLRLSARVLYFLRDHLSTTGLEISWGHLLSANRESCSPECDIIVHEPGVVSRWNGYNNPVMNFSFIDVRLARLVVSCKSTLSSIDAQYPRDLKKHGITNVFLFAETCKTSRFESLRAQAVKAGYTGLWCLYTTPNGDASRIVKNEPMLVDFGAQILEVATKQPSGKRIKRGVLNRSSGRRPIVTRRAQ
jgi:hypothetical protein